MSPIATCSTRRSDASIPGHRAVVVLHFFLGMPLPDVAAAMSIPEGTARSRLHYSIVAMRKSVLGEPAIHAGPVAGGQTA